MKKKLLGFLCAGFLMVSGCASGSKLPDGFDQTAVETCAKTVIEDLNNAKYDELYAMFDEQMSAAITAEMMETDLGPAISEKGEFVEYTGEQYGSAKDKNSGKTYAVCVISCKYENGTLTYTISIDSDGKVGGLYFK